MPPPQLSDQELASVVAEMPPVSAVLQRILAVLQDPHSDLDDIARLVRAETALAAQVLRMANSAFFSLPAPVASVEEAIQRLGVAEINRLVSVLGSRQFFLRPLTAYGLTADALWQHTLAVAVAGETIATYAQSDRGSAYLAGILHPVGLVALDRLATARRLAPRPREATLLEWERATFGTTNAAVAALALRHWKFPAHLAATVAGRYAPDTAGEAASAASVLHVASILAHNVGAGLAPERGLFRLTPERLAAAGLPWEMLAEAELETGQNLERTRALLGVV